ncbi:MAG: cupin domain-containing protein [Candidatus Omnitrophica bacterium]|nr:cupin domain-containing protein [Candidatus Omnitrophota bacterium]MBU1872057.1 cupin domain-containing protein [Candidatus Omnitrophota bacterium]
MEIKVERIDKDTLKNKAILNWPIWEKEVSSFDWHYDSTEVCYLLEGRVVVKTEDGKEVAFGAGDLVTFPKGLSCTWDIKEPVRKHYNFK